jgi:hypothetical protein
MRAEEGERTDQVSKLNLFGNLPVEKEKIRK